MSMVYFTLITPYLRSHQLQMLFIIDLVEEIEELPCLKRINVEERKNIATIPLKQR